MGVVLSITAMRVEDCDGASPQRFAPDLTIEIIQALPPAAHERAAYDRCVLVEGRAEHCRDRQDDVPRDDILNAKGLLMCSMNFTTMCRVASSPTAFPA